MSCFKLNLPTDIPWKRVCVTDEMVDRAVCDETLPPKWQSSLALFKFVPEEEYQLYPDYDISYLKVTATITGYQPLDEEIQGEIDWGSLSVETREGITELLSSYYPCHGAILQVVVGPKGKDPQIPKSQYPFFMDFEPKKRELYELATDTREKQSRSIETLNLTKSGGQTQSQEIMDIDMGGGGFGHEVKVFGTGGGFNYQAPQGQWGTKSMNTSESMESRSTDVGQEKRETYSFTTHLSQMYHLLDSYHIGTNRAVFFVQPRPHVLEESTGFVRGPRPVEGMQEFFLIVAQPKNQDDYCVSLRLDTSHLTEEDILDYDTKTGVSEMASAQPTIPTRNDRRVNDRYKRACFIGCWDVTYRCYQSRDVDDKVYTAPSGYIITGRSDLVNDTFNGSTSAIIAPGSKNLTVHAEATAEKCFEYSGVCVDCPDEWPQWVGYARRRVQVNLRSEIPTRKIGTRQVMLITTRGLCCCPELAATMPSVSVTGVYRIPDYFGTTVLEEAAASSFSGAEMVAAYGGAMVSAEGSKLTVASQSGARATHTTMRALEKEECDCDCAGQPPAAPSTAELQMPIRKANEMTVYIKDQMLKNRVDTRPENAPKSFIETDLFMNKLQSYIGSYRTGRDTLNRTIGDDLPKGLRDELKKNLGKKKRQLIAFDLLTLNNRELGKLADIEPAEAARFKLSYLGLKFKKKKKAEKGRKKRSKS